MLLPPGRIKQAATALARAFREDPYYTYILPDVPRRDRMMQWILEGVVRYGLLYGRVYTTPAVEGAAVWLGPKRPSIHLIGAMRTGLFLMPLIMSRKEMGRITRLDRAGDRLHEQAISGPHWFLIVLGVDPAYQGQGIGGALMQPMLEAAGRAGLACFLDTNNEKNLAFYGRHGFEITGRERPDPEGPYVWGFLKKPSQA